MRRARNASNSARRPVNASRSDERGPGHLFPTKGSAQNRASGNLYAKPFASHETAVELVLAVEEDVVPPDRADMGQ